MRVAVIGAGAVGGTIAALLAKSGHSVEVTARGAHLAAIRAHGLLLSGVWGSWTAPVEANETLLHKPEIAFVATKAHDAEAALRCNATVLAGIPVVIVQNGLESVTAAARLLPDSTVLGALALFAASFHSPGEVRVTTAGTTYLGGSEAEGTRDAAAEAARILGEAMPVAVTENFVGAQWTKLVVNQVNALPAITGLSAQAVIADRNLRRVMTSSMRETVRVGLAAGVTFAPLQGLSDRLLRWFARAPGWVGQLLPAAMGWRMGQTPNPGSTLQSIRRGQPTEIDYLNGAVVRSGAERGVPTPVNTALVALVHEVEKTGVFLPPSAVLAVIRRSAPTATNRSS